MNNKTNIDLLNEKSEPIKEFLAKSPTWLLTWGTSVMFVIVLLLITLTFVLRYPDIVNSNAKIVTKNPPITVVANSEGLLDEILVKDNDVVSSNTILAVIDNAANARDVLFLKNLLGRTEAESINVSSLSEKLELGEIQHYYNHFLKTYNQLSLFKALHAEEVQADLTKKQLTENQNLRSKLYRQRELYVQELHITEKEYKRHQELFKNSFASTQELEKSEKEYLVAKRSIESLDVEVIKVNILIMELQETLERLNVSRIEKDNEFIKAFHDSYKILQLAISEWEEKYLLVSPINGRVSFLYFLSEGQFIKHEDEIFTIVPEPNSEIIAQLILPVFNSGKVQMGQPVNIKLDNYPYHEFGILKGVISKISLVPKGDKYFVEVRLVDGLNTSFQKKLEFRQEMIGKAEVITDDVSLFERIIFLFRKSSP